MQITNNYYDAPVTPKKKNKKAKTAKTVIVQGRGTRWYTGAGRPDQLSQSEWVPSTEIYPPQKGDFYLNSLNGEYFVAPEGFAAPGLENSARELQGLVEQVRSALAKEDKSSTS